MSGSAYRGLSAEQDSRFKDKESDLLQRTKFPSVFAKPVDTSKVSMQVMRPWVSARIEELLGFEDDVVVELIMGTLETEQHPDPRKLQISITGFLEGNTRTFMSELWRHLVSAQTSVGGIPRAFVEQKKAEMQQKRAENEELVEQVRRRAPPPRSEPPRAGGRWDRGQPPLEASSRPPRGRRPPDAFVDKRGNVTRREQDHGWGARARRTYDEVPPADRGAYAREPADHGAYTREAAQERGASRTPSPPPRRYTPPP